MAPLAKRRLYSSDTFSSLRKSLEPTAKYLHGTACVCATGSFGRGEASKNSDLDAFIVDEDECDETKPDKRLNPLDAICVKADLIQSVRKLEIPEFDANGQYLAQYSVGQFTKTLGTSNDDVTNTFTTRLLMLLEGSLLLGEDTYHAVVNKIIAAYWRDFEDHKTDFMPAFFANDILRLWRTFCVNYEARTLREPEKKKAKGKLKNYKLKHSRLLTCYSALLYLLTFYKKQHTVAPADVLNMIALTPTERLEVLRQDADLHNSSTYITRCLDYYQNFLEITSVSEEELVEQFLDKETSRKYLKEAQKFGDSIFDALSEIGKGNPFFRLIVV